MNKIGNANKAVLIVLSLIIIFLLLILIIKKDEPKRMDLGDYFVIDSEWKDGIKECAIIHDKETGVQYFIIECAGYYDITPLYNADGTLKTIN